LITVQQVMINAEVFKLFKKTTYCPHLVEQ
jgi:hypothetical protein